MVFSGTSALAGTAFRLKTANMATGNEAYWATYALCRPFPAKGVCYLRCPTLNRTLAQLNCLYIIPKHGEPHQASAVELKSPSTQQTCRDRAGHRGLFFLYYTKTDQTGQRPYLQREREVALGAQEVHSGANGSKAHNAPPKLFLSTRAILYRVHAKHSQEISTRMQDCRHVWATCFHKTVPSMAGTTKS